MIGRTLLAGIALAISMWASAQALAFEGKFLSSKKLQEAYRHFCPINIGELKDLLRTKKTKVHGTNKLAVETHNHWLKCEYQTDPLHKKLEDPANIKLTEEEIRRIGKEEYIEFAKSSLAETKKKYKIDLLLDLAGSDLGLSDAEIRILVGFAKAKAKSEALVSVLKSL